MSDSVPQQMFASVQVLKYYCIACNSLIYVWWMWSAYIFCFNQIACTVSGPLGMKVRLWSIPHANFLRLYPPAKHWGPSGPKPHSIWCWTHQSGPGPSLTVALRLSQQFTQAIYLYVKTLLAINLYKYNKYLNVR